MAKKAKRETKTEGHGVSALRGNGFDPEKVRSYKERIESLYADMASEQSAYMETCKEIRKDIKSVLDGAKDEGIPKKEFKKVLEACRLASKIEKLRDSLDENAEQDNYDQLMLAIGGLGELPLGQAALAGAARNGVGASA